eukprot:COSAG01_NODE_3132_length_6532_cov_6.151873_10_plen_165_part_01
MGAAVARVSCVCLPACQAERSQARWRICGWISTISLGLLVLLFPPLAATPALVVLVVSLPSLLAAGLLLRQPQPPGAPLPATALDQAGRDIESQWVLTPSHGNPITAASSPTSCRLGQRELRADWLLRGGSWAAGHSAPTPAAAPEAAPPLRIRLGRALLFAVCA